MELKIVKDPGNDDHEFDNIAKLKEAKLWPFDFLSAYGMMPYLKRQNGNIVGVEIGVLKGENIHTLLENCANISLIYGIDPYVEHSDQGMFRSQEYMSRYKKIASENLKSYKKRYKLIEKTSNDAAADFDDNSLDFILLDGDHSYEGIYNDLKNYYPKLKNGGHIFIHDTYLPEVQKAIRDYREENRIRIPLNISKNYINFWTKA